MKIKSLLILLFTIAACSGEEDKAKQWRDAVCKCKDAPCLMDAFSNHHGHEIDGIAARNENNQTIVKYIEEGRKCEAALE